MEIIFILLQSTNTEPDIRFEGGGLAGLAWHTSPVKESPGKRLVQAQDNSFKITIPSSKPSETTDGNYIFVDFLNLL